VEEGWGASCFFSAIISVPLKSLISDYKTLAQWESGYMERLDYTIPGTYRLARVFLASNFAR
ncbi:MAG: hypothetical protein ACRDHW_21955, partial [Ktedonobacteraceae bacterium]